MKNETLKNFNQIKQEVRLANPKATNYIVIEIAKLVYKMPVKVAKKSKLSKFELACVFIKNQNADFVDNKLILEAMEAVNASGGVIFNKLKREFAGATFKDLAKGNNVVDVKKMADSALISFFWESHKNVKKQISIAEWKGKPVENKKYGSAVKLRRITALEILARKIDMDKFNDFVAKASNSYGIYEHTVKVA